MPKDNLPDARQPDQLDAAIINPVGLYVFDPAQAKLVAVTPSMLGNSSPSAPGAAAASIPAASSTGVAANLAGLSVVRINVDNWNTAADMTFETSPDGTTWRPLYDAYGTLVQYKVSGTRAINVPVGDLLRLHRIRVRSGVPGAYVNQTAGATVSLTTAVL